MSKKRKVYSAEFKAKLVLEVLEGIDTVNQIASKYEVQPLNLRNWKKQFLENMSLAFDKSTVVKEYKEEIEILKKDKDELAKKVGNLTIEKDFLEGKLVSLVSSKERKTLLDTKLRISLNKQCELLKVNKSSLYYKAKNPFSTSKEISLLDTINNIYSSFPSYGYRRITKQLQRDGYNVGKKLVKKAMRYMGIKALYPKPKTTIGNKEHYKYPYLLKEFRNDAGQVIIDKVNKVWSTDITYIKLDTGFVYLAAIIDWHSKKILSWKLSNTMDNSLVTTVLKEALTLHPKPEIFNTDQGSQYTSKAHVNILKNYNIKISMDEKGRATDNICIERFWRSIKYEEIYLNEYRNLKILKKSIEKYMDNYNQKRLHSAIHYQTPNEVYFQAVNNSNVEGENKLPKVSA
ncbi:MAG: Mobile element protein [uncultured Sulfurovum sp.]|uniref:Mobile element protein n=2 Tax=uncultured Sulfurovum sp. TaxID=269237 RepID=A0A6S6S2P8_9BACT|nr:MAG: Mobile element protein [uncultured Sulfurovum sp.]